MKITIAALAMMLTAGATYAVHATTKALPNDCSTQINGQGVLRDSDGCDKITPVTCCFLVSDNTEVIGLYTPPVK